MTIALDLAIERAKTLPSEAQDELANLILAFAEGGARYVMSEEEERSFDESIAQEERWDFASDGEVRAMWARFGR